MCRIPDFYCVVHANELDGLLNVCHLQITFWNQETAVAVKDYHFHVCNKLAEELLVLRIPTVQTFAQ